ncbi:hypothetical protein LTR36_002699 [Oleoguttula mirabilis]|uniref:Uncharacterized protein n=1 Tax=Oleoguttula mirabilis TaxID=1507867 RepID=A0AAV9JJY1_9PEZI|nr:hypothetical protein LTR36_002699 [Oleoguttula mirabilis]
MADAHYFHSTLYKLNAEARAHVIERFNTAVNDVAARCWYDDTQDLFELRCPGVIGPIADEALGNAITSYIDEELKAAERQDRPPNAVRFPESTFDAEIIAPVDDEDLHYEGPADETSGSALTPRQSVGLHAKQTRIFHIINSESADHLSLKLFRLHELPDGLLERTLGSATDRATIRAVHSGFTCRAAYLEGKSRKPVFNGRVGQPLPPISAAEEADFLDMVDFPTLLGASTLPEVAPTLRPWKFVDGEEASVSQWLAGMGQTVPDEPGQRPDVPRDAKKMLVVDQNPTLGRVRVPKGASFLPADSDDDDEEEATQAVSGGNSFAQLLQAKGGSDFDSEESDTESQASQDSDDTAVGAKTTFSSLLRPAPPAARPTGAVEMNAKATFSGLLQQPRQESKRPAPPPVQANGPPAARPQALDISSVRQSSSTHSQKERAGTSSESASEPKDSFRSYGKPFAAVDTIGLTADAASQARWEIEHPDPQRARTPKGKIQLASTRKQQHTPMSLSTGPESQRLQPPATSASLASVSQATIRSYADSSISPESWANKIVENCTPDTKLVDDTAPSAATARPRWPPGLGPPPGFAQVAPGHQLNFGQPTAAASHASTNDALIGAVDESSTTRPASSKPPPGLSRKLHPTKGYQTPAQHVDEDQIVERIQPQSDEPVVKRYTMRQKTGPRKGKGATATKKSYKVELPLPDPLPPPRVPKIRETPPAATPGNTSTARTGVPAAAEPGSISAVVSVPAAISPNPPLERSLVLQKLEAFLGTTADSVFEIQFGLVLINTDDKALRKNTLSSLNVEFVDVKATWDPRLTTQTKDAHYLCNLTDGTLHCKTLYENHVRDAGGRVLQIPAEIIMCATTGIAEVVRSQVVSEVARCYLHYPVIMWDAMVVQKSGEPLEMPEGIDSFLASLRTIGHSPSFTAIVPPSSPFAVEKVLAKREYSRSMAGGGCLVVTEVQELELSSLNAPQANMQASALPRDEMVAGHKLWWEARIELQDVTALSNAIDMVARMDGIGFENRGPWVRREADGRENVVPENPFW